MPAAHKSPPRFLTQSPKNFANARDIRDISDARDARFLGVSLRSFMPLWSLGVEGIHAFECGIWGYSSSRSSPPAGSRMPYFASLSRKVDSLSPRLAAALL